MFQGGKIWKNSESNFSPKSPFLNETWGEWLVIPTKRISDDPEKTKFKYLWHQMGVFIFRVC